MTERAKIRETYKSKKRLPAPEVPKPLPKKHYKPKKIFQLQHRYTAEAREKHGWSNSVFRKFYKWQTNEWKKDGAYATYELAELVMTQFMRKHSNFCKQFEYRIIEVKK